MARIYKRKGKLKESWILDYTDVNKKRHRRVIGHTDTTTKKFAERIRVEKERELFLQKEGIPVIKKIPTDKFFNLFRQEKLRNVSEQTMHNYESRINFWERTHQGPQHFTPLSYDRIIEKINEILLRPSTVNQYLVCLKQIYRFAIKLNLIRDNPTFEIKLSKKGGRKPPRYFTKEETRKIIQNSNEYYSDLFQVFLYTGMRMSELRYLEWTDIDFDNEIIKIKIKEGFTPKNKKQRSIPIHSSVKRILLKRRKENGLVFPTQQGELSPSITWYSYLKRLLKRLDIKNASIHTWRHTFASWLTIEDVTMRKIAELLGHSKIETTMIYSHLSPYHTKKAVQRLPKI